MKIKLQFLSLLKYFFYLFYASMALQQFWLMKKILD